MCAPLSMAGGIYPVDAGYQFVYWLLLRLSNYLVAGLPPASVHSCYMRQDSWCVAHVHVGHRARWYADLGHPVDVVLVVVAAWPMCLASGFHRS